MCYQTTVVLSFYSDWSEDVDFHFITVALTVVQVCSNMSLLL